MKDDFNSTDPASASVVRVVDALNDMRDSLVIMSLALQDYQFHLESPERKQLDQMSQALIQKAKG